MDSYQIIYAFEEYSLHISPRKAPIVTKITSVQTHDVRFPTGQHGHGSDAMNKDPDYSAAYLVLDTDEPGLEGHSLVFTIGRGNDLQCEST